MKLGRRRSDDENSFGSLESPRDVGEEAAHVVGMLVRPRRPFWMAMNAMLGRFDNRLIDARRADAEDARLVMIDPHGGTWMKSHSNVLRRCDAHVYGDDRNGSRFTGEGRDTPGVSSRHYARSSALARLGSQTNGRTLSTHKSCTA